MDTIRREHNVLLEHRAGSHVVSDSALAAATSRAGLAGRVWRWQCICKPYASTRQHGDWLHASLCLSLLAHRLSPGDCGRCGQHGHADALAAVEPADRDAGRRFGRGHGGRADPAANATERLQRHRRIGRYRIYGEQSRRLATRQCAAPVATHARRPRHSALVSGSGGLSLACAGGRAGTKPGADHSPPVLYLSGWQRARWHDSGVSLRRRRLSRSSPRLPIRRCRRGSHRG